MDCLVAQTHPEIQSKDEKDVSIFLCPAACWEGDILFLVWIPLALAFAWHFLVCTISCEPVIGFLINFHGYIIGT